MIKKLIISCRSKVCSSVYFITLSIFNYVLEKPSMIADDIRAVERRDDDPMSQILCNDKTPSEEPYYKYVLDNNEPKLIILHAYWNYYLTKSDNKDLDLKLIKYFITELSKKNTLILIGNIPTMHFDIPKIEKKLRELIEVGTRQS